jgi:hypothetical protein
MNVLDLDFSRAMNFSDDYDNDLSWEIIEKDRNIYYQKKLANEIMRQVNEMISLLTSILNIHLNIGQNLTINTSEVFMSLETVTMNSFLNKQIQQVGNAQIHIPTNFTSNLNKNSKISIRVWCFFLNSFISIWFFFLVYDGTFSFIW